MALRYSFSRNNASPSITYSQKNQNQKIKRKMKKKNIKLVTKQITQRNTKYWPNFQPLCVDWCQDSQTKMKRENIPNPTQKNQIFELKIYKNF